MSDRIKAEFLHIIDYDNKTCELQNFDNSFNNYIKFLIKMMEDENNKKCQNCRIKRDSTEVISLILKCINEDNFEVDYFYNIAKKLLDVEYEVSEKIERLGVEVKKGVLYQTIINNGDKYTYVATKMEYTTFFEIENLKKTYGINENRKNVWKSCLITFSKREHIFEIQSIKVYLDNSAKYWIRNFLEVEGIIPDDKNTKEAYEKIDTVLEKYIKKKSPSDYWNLSNYVKTYFATNELFDIDNIIKQISNYTFEKDDCEKDKLLKKLNNLTEDEKFDNQFTIDKSKLPKLKIKHDYKLIGNKLTVLAKQGLSEEEMMRIKTYKDENGNMFFNVQIDDSETFETFKQK